jgi:hypothetical protein
MLLWINGPFGGGKTQTAHSTDQPLSPNTDGALRGRLRRAWIGAKHLRLD